jgi:16S rRNA (guanine527-N7)-methyltransferase
MGAGGSGRWGPDEAAAEGRARLLETNLISRETAERLDRFVETLQRWQPVVPLIGASTWPDLWTRHVADSLQLVALAPAARIWVDFGSGGGFPGLVIACALAEVPGACVHLVERHGKKAAFLREAARASGAAALVHQNSVQAFVHRFEDRVDLITARAFAPLRQLVPLTEPLLKKGAEALFPKGQDVAAELTEVSKYWKIDVSLIPSQTDPRGRIVHIRSAQRRPPPGPDSPIGMKRSRP